jgi:hypothetical protein
VPSLPPFSFWRLLRSWWPCRRLHSRYYLLVATS